MKDFEKDWNVMDLYVVNSCVFFVILVFIKKGLVMVFMFVKSVF